MGGACVVVSRRYSLVLSAVCVAVLAAGSSHVTAATAESGGVRGARFTLTGAVRGAAAARDAIRCARRRVQAASGDRFEVDGCRNVTGDSTVNNDTPVLHRVPQGPLAVNAVASGITGPEATLDMSAWTCSATACYLIVNDDPGTQPDSRAKCRALHPAVDLLVLDSEEESLYVYHELFLGELLIPGTCYWLGIEETTGTLPGAWIDGSGADVIFQKWTPSEPNNNHEFCAVVIFNLNTWFDYPCDHTNVNYVCKFENDM